MDSKQLNVVLGVVVLVLLGLVGYLAVKNNPNSDDLNRRNSTPHDRLSNANSAPSQPGNPTISPNNSQPAPLPIQDSPSVSSWQTYTNQDFNFQLTFPTAWQGYLVVKRPQSTVNVGVAMYEVRLKTTEKNFGDGNVDMFVVAVYPKKMWQDLQAEGGPQPTYITEKSGYVFTYSTAQDYPKDRMGLVKDVSGIISTLKFTK